MSNRLVLVNREEVHPHIEGCDFGGRCVVLARCPTRVLLWVMGHAWSVNGNLRYSGPVMYLIRRDRKRHGTVDYERLSEDVGLSRKVYESRAVSQTIRAVFGEDAYEKLLEGLRPPGKTLIVDGGGPPLMPCRHQGEAAYQLWRSQERKGLYG